jgi:type I restriction enzyme, S subunit
VRDVFDYVPLKRVSHIRYGLGEPPPEIPDGVPFVRATDISKGRIDLSNVKRVDPNEVPRSRDAFLNPGDVLVVRSGAYTGDSARIPESLTDGVAGYDMVLRPHGIHSSFLGWCLLAPEVTIGQIDLLKARAAQPHLNAEELGSVRIPLPAVGEQEAIASFLDRETALIDTLIEKKRRLLDLLEEKRTALITRAVSRGLDPDVPMKDSGVEWIGEIPEHWEVTKLGIRFSVQLGKMLDASRIIGDQLQPYLRVADVQWGEINIRDLPLMDFSPADRARYHLQPGDLLVNEGGSYVGRSAIWQGELDSCFYQKALHRVRARSSNDSTRFLYYVMWWGTHQGVFIAGGNQTTIDHLTAEQLRSYRFAFPPFGEQEEIADRLDDAMVRINEVEERVSAAMELLREYRATLISSAVTGQVQISELTASEGHCVPAEATRS